MHSEIEAGKRTGTTLIITIGIADARAYTAAKIRRARRWKTKDEFWFWIGAAYACRMHRMHMQAENAARNELISSLHSRRLAC
jgi:hypothetical protein